MQTLLPEVCEELEYSARGGFIEGLCSWVSGLFVFMWIPEMFVYGCCFFVVWVLFG